MAAQKSDIPAQAEALVREAQEGTFRQIYLLMGDEPYYPDLVCKAILDNCIDEFGKDFNETVCYGTDVTSEWVTTQAREYPMMTERRLVVVKEAQLMKDIEALSVYCSSPLDSTVLVLLLHKGSVDKRKALYKAVQKNGVVLESPALKDYEVPAWIQSYYRSRNLNIDPQAVALMAEAVGTELCTIVTETDKLLKNLPQGTNSISVEDVEKNVGISRQFSIFELTRELSYRRAAGALKIAAMIGSTAKFSLAMAVGALYSHFYRILKYSVADDKSKALPGVSPYFYKEYDAAVRNYPLPKVMDVISILCEYDYLGKGGAGSGTPEDQLFVELVAKILNV